MYSFIFSTSFFPSWYLSFTWCVFSSAFGAWEHVSSLEHWLCRFWRTWFIPSEGLRDVLTFWRRRLKKHGVYNRGFRGPSHQKNRSIPCESRVCFQHVSNMFPHFKHIQNKNMALTPSLEAYMSIIWALYNLYNLKNEVMHMYSRLRERLHQRPMAMAGNVKQLSLANATNETANSC